MLRESLEMVRSTRSRTIALAEQLWQEQLDFTSATGKWSAGEVLDHFLDYHDMSVQHPLMGTNDIPGLLRFVALHEQRHQSQINNIIASPQFPRPQPSGKGVSHVEF